MFHNVHIELKNIHPDCRKWKVCPLARKLNPWECFGKSIIFTKIWKNRQKSPVHYLEEDALELRRAATTKPREIERSGTNSSLETGLRSTGCFVVEKTFLSKFGHTILLKISIIQDMSGYKVNKNIFAIRSKSFE